MFINHSSKEVTAKIVYYGPGLSGKTSNLQYIFSITNPKSRGELISIETEIERTLFFDLLPLNVGLVKGYQTKFQLYTVPGQVFYDSTRKLVLKGADGIVFVADSQELMKTANIESLDNLRKNLELHKQDINEMPLVIQFNKRDLSNILPLEELNRSINHLNRPHFGAVAIKGEGVIETLREISSLILTKLKKLLDHNDDPSKKSPAVQFDTNRKKKIIDREKLPLKKIQTENLEEASKKIEPEKKEVLPEKELKVESANDFEDLEELILGEDLNQVEEIDDLDEIKFEEDPIVFESTRELDEQKVSQYSDPETNSDTNPDLSPDLLPPSTPGAEDLMKETEDLLKSAPPKKEAGSDDEEPEDLDAFLLTELDDNSLDDVDEIIDLEDIRFDDSDTFSHLDHPMPPPPKPAPPKPVETKPAETKPETAKPETKAKTPPKPKIPVKEETKPKAEPKPKPEPKAQTKPEPKPKAPAKDSNVKSKAFQGIEDIQKSLAQQKTEKPKYKNNKTQSLDMFERMKDKTRVTVIRKINVKENQVLVDIKDKDSNILDTIKVDISKDTKKITLILDVKE